MLFKSSVNLVVVGSFKNNKLFPSFSRLPSSISLSFGMYGWIHAWRANSTKTRCAVHRVQQQQQFLVIDRLRPVMNVKQTPLLKNFMKFHAIDRIEPKKDFFIRDKVFILMSFCLLYLHIFSSKILNTERKNRENFEIF